MTREDRIHWEIEQWEANLRGVREMAVEMGDPMLGALTIGGQEERAIESLRDELKQIELQRLREEAWEDHWLLEL